MVFRGRPSKACKRCRDRRLKCDLSAGSCGQCQRGGVVCSGYRDTQQLRIRNESEAVRKKALSRCSPPVIPQSPILSLEYQAREAFFAHHIAGPAKTWSFLLPLYGQIDIPEYLNLTFDAVSLAHLWHVVYSETALVAAKKKYVSALHMTSKALQSTSVAMEDTALVTSLLLDLFEKITNIEPRHIKSWSSHIIGALALVALRGLDQFTNHADIRALVRLSTNLLINCVATESSVPEELLKIRAYVEKFLDTEDPKWKATGLMVHYANLRSDIRSGCITTEDAIYASLDLDSKLEMLSLDMPPTWIYQAKVVEAGSKGIYGRHFDLYPSRHVTQTWNVIRLVRILLNDFVVEHSLESPSPSATMNAKRKIQILSGDICASVSQYVNGIGVCGTNSSSIAKQLSPDQKQDCYTLIFPLYVAGQSPSSVSSIRPRAVKQLHHMGGQFGIRNAELVSQILEKGGHIDSWSVYAMLGSYAFAA